MKISWVQSERHEFARNLLKFISRFLEFTESWIQKSQRLIARNAIINEKREIYTSFQKCMNWSGNFFFNFRKKMRFGIWWMNSKLFRKLETVLDKSYSSNERNERIRLWTPAKTFADRLFNGKNTLRKNYKIRWEKSELQTLQEAEMTAYSSATLVCIF